MKHFTYSILVVFILSIGSTNMVAAQDNARTSATTLWDEANAAYVANDYASASAIYDSIEQSGMVSAKLYYNKAGALFKMGEIGESILYYSKAQRLAPSDADVAHNLAIVSSYTRNKIEPIPDFFLKRWMRSLGSIMSGDGWAWLSLILFAGVLAGTLLYLLPLGHHIRKTGLYGLSALVLLTIFAFSFARRDWKETASPSGGIVTSPSAAVKSSPDNSGKDLFLLYEGDRVQVLDAMNGWNEITVVNGNRGWIRSGAVSMID
ncbi:MAG: SH3 domain-containing protein [Alistipes sp.]|jgi:tetratricopeptide (TPR) repeat protein|nr:SH3 domain-containing protein [Alistipes sp.]